MAKGRRSGAVHKALALLACLGFAFAALGNGMDRRSFLRPIAAARVPAVFADMALITRGQSDLLAGRSAQALAFGEAAVRRAPIEPVSPALLGAARYSLGDVAGADRAFRIAGQMGWRVPLTQAYWMQQALAVKDWRVAAERLDALLRQHPWMADEAQLLDSIEVWPEGQKALVDRIAKAPPRWVESYARGVERRSEAGLARHGAVLTMLAERGVIVGCDFIAPLTSRLTERGKLAEAQAQWRRHCPEAGSGLLADPGLVHARVTPARTYFEWDIIGSGDVGMVLVPEGEGGGKRLELNSSAPLPRVVMRQLIAVPPGAYRLGWQARNAAGVASPQITAALGCNAQQAVQLPATPSGAGQWSADLRVTGDCQAHWLVFSILPGTDDIRFGRLSLEKR